MVEGIFEKVRNLDKTRFALELMAANPHDWVAPAYVIEGLTWLAHQLGVGEGCPEATSSAMTAIAATGR